MDLQVNVEIKGSRAPSIIAAALAMIGQAPSPAQLKAYASQLVPWLSGTAPAHMSLTVEGDQMPLTVDSANSNAVLSFTDDHNDAVSAPDGAVATAASDNTAVLTVGPSVSATDANGNGIFTFPLTEVAEGSANLSVTVVDASGNPLLGPDGVTPIAAPAPVAVTVNPGAAADEVFTVPGN